MDPRPDGPRKIGERHQVTLPAEQLATIGVGPGDSVWVTINPDRPGTLVVMPEDFVAELFRKGWTSIAG